ncbi:MAG: sn-glycerol-3-phosphate ABC transporter ATP-binding protein UgpC [Roseburia sp.]|nr:sn-glycerol-3-phosphate ABC transporter ATP-binding protein UgpC [Anaeroplasma bactoclasticum]MCM1196213.1 sn-glycerol-3-phosphate ABC transporter ATP-binding protein UgpC [Roseburia sp.]MCM1556020.1 sn-glycerol-3-phosphate ABC transporter ATP-binding protein UgpC [Anaeroplasma bactoclasticum]
MSELILKNVNKIYPNGAHAVHNFNLTVKDGEFVVLVGPSGCGKSTTLRMIAGLEGITEGDMLIDGERVNSLAPVDRDIAMVFQNYALYYNMSVYDNIGISLKIRHEQKQAIHKNVKAAAERFSLTEYLNRRPANLSGGQKQRVALGRTVVRDPKIFLMDEPLSNLDAKLREQTRSEIVKLQKSLNTTTIYVTHDQIEAMTMADRIVVMSMGYVQQIGTPLDIYNNPSNLFVAGFIGMPNMNIIDGRIEDEYFVFGENKVKIQPKDLNKLKKYNHKEVKLGIRPEHIDCSQEMLKKYPLAVLELPIDHAEFLGKEYYVDFLLPDAILKARLNSKYDLDVDRMKLVLNMDKVHYFDPETTNRIVEE